MKPYVARIQTCHDVPLVADSVEDAAAKARKIVANLGGEENGTKLMSVHAADHPERPKPIVVTGAPAVQAA